MRGALASLRGEDTNTMRHIQLTKVDALYRGMRAWVDRAREGRTMRGALASLRGEDTIISIYICIYICVCV